MKFSEFLAEQKKEEKKKAVFKETDGSSAFPENTIAAIRSEISSLAKDLDQEWKNVSTLINTAFENLEVPAPQAYQRERWAQYKELVGHAVKQLYLSRGLNAPWSKGV